MRPIQHVLVAIDFSDAARTALASAAALARQFSARLTVLYVSPYYAPLDEWTTFPVVRPLDDERKRTLEEELRQFVNRPGSDYPLADVVVREGDPGEEVLRYVSAGRVDLVVLGTHGRRGFQRWVVGSVTHRVSRTADCMVLAVPPRSETTKVSGVLCAVDLSESSDETIEHAAAFARAMAAQLIVLHVVDGPHGFEPWVLLGQTEEEARRALCEAARAKIAELVARHTWGGLTVEVRVTAGEPPHEIERAVEAGIELAVLGVRPASGIDHFFFGSTAQHVLRAARCPLLLVRHRQVAGEHPAKKDEGVATSS